MAAVVGIISRHSLTQTNFLEKNNFKKPGNTKHRLACTWFKNTTSGLPITYVSGINKQSMCYNKSILALTFCTFPDIVLE